MAIVVFGRCADTDTIGFFDFLLLLGMVVVFGIVGDGSNGWGVVGADMKSG